MIKIFSVQKRFKITSQKPGMNSTRFIRPFFVTRARRTDSWGSRLKDLQEAQLRTLLRLARDTETGRRHDFKSILGAADLHAAYSENLSTCGYEDIRPDVMRMVRGERDVLWPGVCRDYAQSSGTSGGRSKFIPITARGLHRCHYRGSADCVAHYLRHNPGSRLFDGKAFVLGGSFATTLPIADRRVHVGDLSATLIKRMNRLANMLRVPDINTALLPDWTVKLPALVQAAKNENITNISGVPSWFLTVIKEVLKARGATKVSEVWPGLEVFFHGGISFEPYRHIYKELTRGCDMHFVETYNASEGFFAVQNNPDDPAMLLIIDNDIFYEFIDISDPAGKAVPAWEVEEGKVYELLITSSNGLWRYHLGDTVRICSTAPLKIMIAGRTRTFINAFGEELMEDNAERAMAEACRSCGASIRNYTAAPVFATETSRGRHQWLIDWLTPPAGTENFAITLDAALRRLNSDYDAKRSHTIFLDPPLITSVPPGTFERWLAEVGNRKLGGQRKIPRLSNDRTIADAIMKEMGQSH